MDREDRSNKGLGLNNRNLNSSRSHNSRNHSSRNRHSREDLNRKRLNNRVGSSRPKTYNAQSNTKGSVPSEGTEEIGRTNGNG